MLAADSLLGRFAPHRSVTLAPEGTDATQRFVILTFEFHREEPLWVGECRELGTATDGRSLAKVEKELAALVTVHLKGLRALEERERVFAERGIQLYAEEPPPTVERPVLVSTDGALIRFRPVPVPDGRAAASVG